MRAQSLDSFRYTGLLHDMLFDDLKKHKFGMTEMERAVSVIKNWLQEYDPTPEQIQHMDGYYLNSMTGTMKHIVNLLRECENTIALGDITEFNKAMDVIPKLCAIEYFKGELLEWRRRAKLEAL